MIKGGSFRPGSPSSSRGSITDYGSNQSLPSTWNSKHSHCSFPVFFPRSCSKMITPRRSHGLPSSTGAGCGAQISHLPTARRPRGSPRAGHGSPGLGAAQHSGLSLGGHNVSVASAEHGLKASHTGSVPSKVIPAILSLSWPAPAMKCRFRSSPGATTHLVHVEDEVQFADILKALVQRLHKHLGQTETRQDGHTHPKEHSRHGTE